MPATNFTTAPSETVKKRFSTSVETVGGVPGESPTMPPINTADLGQQPAPQNGPSQEDITAFYKPLLDQVQNEQTPLSRPVPADVSPLGTFLGTLAGNLASTFAQNPAFAQQAQQYLAQQHAQKQAIEEQNYANQLAFDVEKRNKIISIRGQILEKTLDEAIKSGDLQKANVASQNLAKFQEGLKRETQREEAQQRQAIVQEQGRQERLTEKTKASLKASEEAAAATKPLTTKQYLDARNAVAKNKELDDTTRSKWQAFGIHLPFGPRESTPTGRELEAEQIDVTVIKNGEPTAIKSAKANLKRSILKRLNLLGTSVTPEGRAAVQNELQQYGLTMEDVR